MPDTSGFIFKCDNCDFLLTAMDGHGHTYIQPCPDCLDDEREIGREENQDDLRDGAFKDGYDEGHTDGYDEGYDEGRSDGQDEGYEVAQKELRHS